MTKEPIHIVSFDVPYPPDYGGAAAVFNEIIALHHAKEHLILHCFDYGRGRQPQLLKYCDEVYYYKRRWGVIHLLKGLPYIVASRAEKQLLRNIKKTPGRVLLQGVHCSWLLFYGNLQNVVLRLHNVEYIYYRHLAASSNHVCKKIYYLIESFLLKKYEKKIAAKARIAAFSQADALVYSRQLAAKEVVVIPPFLPNSHVHIKPGKGSYGLYHGNLGVAENEKAIVFLLQHVFGKLPFKFVVAGKNPSSALKKKIKGFKNVELRGNVSESEMQELTQNAHVHYIHSVNNTGVKIKLLNALSQGRFVIANENAVTGSGMENLCHIAGSAEEYLKITATLFERDFDEKAIENRQQVLLHFHNRKHAADLLKMFKE